MLLTPIELLNGILSLTTVVLAFILGIKIIVKYYKYRKKELLLVGSVCILLYEAWWPSVISFIMILITNEGLPPEMFFIIGNVGLPIAGLLWIWALTEIMVKKKKILLVFIIYGTLIEIIFFTLLIINPSYIGNLSGSLYVDYSLFVLIFSVSYIIIFLLSGILFYRIAIKSDNSEIRLKAKFLIIAFISFTLGTIIGVIDSPGLFFDIPLVLSRIVLISSVIEFYLGFILPNFIKKKIRS